MATTAKFLDFYYARLISYSLFYCKLTHSDLWSPALSPMATILLSVNSTFPQLINTLPQSVFSFSHRSVIDPVWSMSYTRSLFFYGGSSCWTVTAASGPVSSEEFPQWQLYYTVLLYSMYRSFIYTHTHYMYILYVLYYMFYIIYVIWPGPRLVRRRLTGQWIQYARLTMTDKDRSVHYN